MTISGIEQNHFFEDRFTERHNTVYFSQVPVVEPPSFYTLAECGCGEVFFARTEQKFSGERSIKTQWRAHAKGRKQ